MQAIENPTGIDLRTPAGLKQVKALFKEQHISPDKPPDGRLESVWLSGGLYTFLATGKETKGQYALFDFVVPPQAGPPAHIHHEEDEAFYVLDGEINFQVNNQVFEGGPGTLVPYLRNDLHAFRNLGTEPARMLVLATPAGIEDLFREGGQSGTDPLTPPAPDVAKFLEAAPKYGVEPYNEATLFGKPLPDDGGITLLGDDRSETLLGSKGSDIIIGRQGKDRLEGNLGNDILAGGTNADQINGGRGNDLVSGDVGNDTLTGGKGQDTFLISRGQGTDTITDFSGVGKGNAAVKVDGLQFQGPGLSARNLLLNQDGSDLKITFENIEETGVILQDFALENLDNLNKVAGASVGAGNVLFDGQTEIQDDFDVINAGQTLERVYNRNSVTFLNELDNNIQGFDNSDDVINGQGGNDRLKGLSGDDLLRGGAGQDTLIGGTGSDQFVLTAGTGTDTITDFISHEDLIQLSSGIKFADLTITQGIDLNQNNTFLGLTNRNEPLAILNGVQASTLTSSSDFKVV